MSPEHLPDAELLGAGPDERAQVLGTLLERHQDRLLRMVQMRMHPKVRARVGASDVVQEACVEAHRLVDQYVGDPQLPFFLWLRRITAQRLMKAHRFHLDAQRRDARRDAGDDKLRMPETSVVAMVDILAADRTSPHSAVARDERRDRITAALEEMSPTDREVLSMRHFEELSNEEVAAELGLGKHAASKRYIRALQRLKQLLGEDGL
ncbi:MAG: sigma-70 family RNA polymerase sigma factor [Planctomycetota bacterium]|nr:sigma-70 family RNA polymerase sigma factor [Planctomycetota bacterium]